MKSSFRLFKGAIGCMALMVSLSFSPSNKKQVDLAGTRALSTINFVFINNAGGGFTVTLTDAVTGQDYTLHSVNGANAYYNNLPEGVYHIYMWPSETDWIYYEVGCNTPFETKGEVWVDEVTINSTCSTITAN
jgi:hypothetical protein